MFRWIHVGGASARCQRGVAAIEFALVLVVLFLCLYIIVTFGAALYTRQVLARAAADGAFAISSSSRSYQAAAVQEVVFTSLARSLVTPVGVGAADTDYAARLNWVRQNVTVDLTTSAGGTPSVELAVRYPYEDHAILPSLPALGLLMPEELTGRAVVAIGP